MPQRRFLYGVTVKTTAGKLGGRNCNVRGCTLGSSYCQLPVPQHVQDARGVDNVTGTVLAGHFRRASDATASAHLRATVSAGCGWCGQLHSNVSVWRSTGVP
jgi:hypothetical protein